MTIRILNLAALLAIAACTVPQPTTSWQRTGDDDAARRASITACHARANRELDRASIGRDDVGRSDAFGQQSTWGANMATYEAKKSQTALFDRCMIESGYQKVKMVRP